MYELLDKLSFKCRTFKSESDTKDTCLYTKEVWKDNGNRCDLYFLYSIPSNLVTLRYKKEKLKESVYKSIRLKKITLHSRYFCTPQSVFGTNWNTNLQNTINHIIKNKRVDLLNKSINISNIFHFYPNHHDGIDLNKVKYKSNNMESFLREYFKSELRDIRLKHILSKPNL